MKFSELTLPTLPRPVKALFIGYLLAVGLGLCVAGMQIMLTHGMADGKSGLSLDDIVYSYYGHRDGSTIESKLNGSMKEMAEPEVRLDIIKWARNGAPESEWEPHFKGVFGQYCVMCHSTMPGIPDFSKYEEVKKLAEVDTGASVPSLTRVSHIHLFGISFIFFFMGLIFCFAVGVPEWLKVLAISTPFVFLIVDVLSWWLTKWSPGFAWLTIIGGVGYSLASTFMWVVSMYQMVIMPCRARESGAQ
ncbi:MAG: elongation factor-1 alpha [Gallionellaceae bacterium]|jgi:hypothetical protein|nr:elongation factor-1 alpha [Gallionellaceae bacterium]